MDSSPRMRLHFLPSQQISRSPFLLENSSQIRPKDHLYRSEPDFTSSLQQQQQVPSQLLSQQQQQQQRAPSSSSLRSQLGSTPLALKRQHTFSLNTAASTPTKTPSVKLSPIDQSKFPNKEQSTYFSYSNLATSALGCSSTSTLQTLKTYSASPARYQSDAFSLPSITKDEIISNNSSNQNRNTRINSPNNLNNSMTRLGYSTGNPKQMIATKSSSFGISASNSSNSNSPQLKPQYQILPKSAHFYSQNAMASGQQQSGSSQNSVGATGSIPTNQLASVTKKPTTTSLHYRSISSNITPAAVGIAAILSKKTPLELERTNSPFLSGNRTNQSDNNSKQVSQQKQIFMSTATLPFFNRTTTQSVAGRQNSNILKEESQANSQIKMLSPLTSNAQLPLSVVKSLKRLNNQTNESNTSKLNSNNTNYNNSSDEDQEGNDTATLSSSRNGNRSRNKKFLKKNKSADSDSDDDDVQNYFYESKEKLPQKASQLFTQSINSFASIASNSLRDSSQAKLHDLQSQQLQQQSEVISSIREKSRSECSRKNSPSLGSTTSTLQRQPTINQHSSASATAANSSNINSPSLFKEKAGEKKKTVQFDFEQTVEQKRFQTDLMKRIRSKLFGVKCLRGLTQKSQNKNATDTGDLVGDIDICDDDATAVDDNNPCSNGDYEDSIYTDGNGDRNEFDSPLLNYPGTNTSDASCGGTFQTFVYDTPVDANAACELIKELLIVWLKSDTAYLPKQYAYFFSFVNLNQFLQCMHFVFSTALNVVVDSKKHINKNTNSNDQTIIGDNQKATNVLSSSPTLAPSNSSTITFGNAAVSNNVTGFSAFRNHNNNNNSNNSNTPKAKTTSQPVVAEKLEVQLAPLLPYRKFFMKIPFGLFASLFSAIKRESALLSYFKNHFPTIQLFEALSFKQYDQLGLKPINFLEEMGGPTRSQALIVGVFQLIQQNLKDSSTLQATSPSQSSANAVSQFTERSVLEFGMSVLQLNDSTVTSNPANEKLITINQSTIDGFMNSLKRTFCISDSDLNAAKFSIYKYLFIDNQRQFNESTNILILSKFESIRFQYFIANYLTFNSPVIVSEIVKSNQAKKSSFQSYFISCSAAVAAAAAVATSSEVVNNNQSNANKQLKDSQVKPKITVQPISAWLDIEIFLEMFMEYLQYKCSTVKLHQWLKEHTCKDLDEQFFQHFQPLLIEHMKANKSPSDFLQIVDLKFFSIKNRCGVQLFDVNYFLGRLDEVMQQMNKWIDAMIQQKQLTKQQSTQINQIENTSFLEYYIKVVLGDDCFYPGEVLFMINHFQVSLDAVHFQLKGIRRILLLMKFKTNDAYEIAEFLIKVFNLSLTTFATNKA